ncbi:hypothetical protein HX005_03450 [Acinetobacter sp. R933-2]|nr:hypothetical protein [Acinetobacter sp. R933-2]
MDDVDNAHLEALPSISTTIEKENHMVSLNDEELSAVQGQALMNLTRTNDTSQGLNFYRLGMEAEIELNANIKKLQLGCGGINGAGNCDIDIDNLALTGVNPVNGEYAASDAKLTNPFIEFAVKNADNSATREIVGFRFGSLEALGKLSLGTNNNTSTPNDDTGINSISGDLNLNLVGAYISDIRVCVGLLTCILNIPTNALVDDTVVPLVLNRASVVNDIGPLVANASLGITLKLDNVHLVNQSVKAIHEIILQNSNGTGGTKDFYLSLQKQSVKWPSVASPGTFRSVAAQRGWWLSLPDVTIKNPVITQRIELSVLTAGVGLFGGRVDIQGIDLGQKPAKNCYGTLTFC